MDRLAREPVDFPGERFRNPTDGRIQEAMRKTAQSFVNRAGRELGTVMRRTSELELNDDAAIDDGHRAKTSRCAVQRLKETKVDEMQEPMKAWLQGLLVRPGQQDRVELSLLLEDFAEQHGDDSAQEFARDIIEHFNSL